MDPIEYDKMSRVQKIAAFLGHSSFIVTEARYAQAGDYNGVEEVNKIELILH
jgi:hypothetical protein